MPITTARMYTRIVAPPGAWATSPAAEQALQRAMHRGQRDIRDLPPSLAGLSGRAREYSGSYMRTRRNVLARAGVRTITLRMRSRTGQHWSHRRVECLVMPGETVRDALTVERAGRGLARAWSRA